MGKFTARNGITVSVDNGVQFGNERGWGFYGIVDEEWQALREFFLAERDAELGRWRWPENPDYVVYPSPAGYMVTVLKEPNGNSGQFDREQFSGMMAGFETSDPGYSRAAHAYFEAHPERKPWEDAKHGEVWLVSIDDAPETPMTVEHEAFDFPRFIEPIEGMSYGPKAGITAARRIWPEGDAS